MDMQIVMIIQMNHGPSARLHVQLICLPVLMACNVFISQEFAMEEQDQGVAMINQTTSPRSVTTVQLIICSIVTITVLMFV